MGYSGGGSTSAGSSDALNNIIDWSAYLTKSEGIITGDRVLYNGITYINLTGTQIPTAPDTDTTNWTILKELLRTLEFIATGNSAPLEDDNWKLETSGIYLIFYRRQGGAWIEIFRTGASLSTDRFIINTTGGSLVFDNNLGQTRTLVKPSVDENGTVLGNPNGRVAFIHSGELFSVNIDNSVQKQSIIQDQTTESVSSTDYSIAMTSSQVQALYSGTISLANVPAGTKVRFSVLSSNNVLLAQNVREFEFQGGGGTSVANGINELVLSEELALPFGYIFKLRLESSNSIDIQGKTVDLGDGRGSRFVPYLISKYYDGVEENVTTSHNVVSQLVDQNIAVGNVHIAGDMTVDGAITSASTENLLVEDNHIVLNDGYQATTTRIGGLVVNYLPTSTVDTVTAGAFVAGIAATSNPTVATVGASVFAQNDIIMIHGSAENNGIYEVHSHTANVLTVRGVGTISTVEEFTNTQFTANASDSATITKINVSVLCSNTSGDWKQGKGQTARE